MKKQEWNEGLSEIDPALVEEHIKRKDQLIRKKKITMYIRITALAACIALLVRIAWPLSPIVDPAMTLPDPLAYSPIVFDANRSPQKLYGSGLEFVVGSSTNLSVGNAAPPRFEFSTWDSQQFVVKAVAVDNYPDTYYLLNSSSEYKPTAYRLIEMECLEVMQGQNVPKSFLYMIPESIYVDMTQYDCLLISMAQQGTEQYVFRNGTKNKLEATPIPVFDDYQGHPELGNIIAFSDGIFDESLWQTESWLYGYQFARHHLEDPEDDDLVVYRGCPLEEAVEEIKSRLAESKAWREYEDPSPVTLEFTAEEAKAAIEFVKPFANGVFAQYCSSTELRFTRYINGCQTEEVIIIDLLTQEVTYSEVRYTQEDMAKLENIAVHLANHAKEYAKNPPTPPHTDPEGKQLWSLTLYAWYVKVDGKIYGVIKTTWIHMKRDIWYTRYLDASYTLYDCSASTARTVTREELVELAGPRNVSQGNYGEGEPLPM